MSIKLAEKIGFCFGVKRAVSMAEKALAKNRPICSLGSIIHNRQVVERLSRKGLNVIKRAEDIKRGALIISSHGLSPKIAGAISKRGIKIIDTTCPFVLNAQRVASRLSSEGYVVVIVGDAKHPEIKALVDFVRGNAVVVKDERQAKRLRFKNSDRVSIIAQTTQSTDKFLAIIRIILEKRPKEIRVFNTICRDAEERQAMAKSLARQVDLMLIIGGRDSANTRRLYEVCKKISRRSHLVETEEELKAGWLKKTRKIGITSGASTPEWVIKKVVAKVNKIQNSSATKRRRMPADDSMAGKERGCVING